MYQYWFSISFAISQIVCLIYMEFAYIKDKNYYKLGVHYRTNLFFLLYKHVIVEMYIQPGIFKAAYSPCPL